MTCEMQARTVGTDTGKQPVAAASAAQVEYNFVICRLIYTVNTQTDSLFVELIFNFCKKTAYGGCQYGKKELRNS